MKGSRRAAIVAAVVVATGAGVFGTPAGSASAATCTSNVIIPSGTVISGDQTFACGGSALIQKGDAFFIVDGYGSRRGVCAPAQNIDFTVMQGDGNLVSYRGNRPVWNTETAGTPGAYLAVQTDGNIVLYRADGSPRLIIGC